MQFVGIDIGAEKHWVAVVDEAGGVVVKATAFTEDLSGYEALFRVLAPSEDTLIAMEATGHYWQNLFATLVASGYRVALLNPVRTARFAEEEGVRAKTDAIDALGIARFASQKRPRSTPLPDEATVELREMVRLRDRYVQDLGDRVRQLHRAVDLSFPELTRHIQDLGSQIATTLLRQYPTAVRLRQQSPKRLGKLVYDGRHVIGDELATALVEAAKTSVGRHQGPAFQTQVEHACEDIDTLRRRIKSLEKDIGASLDKHDVGSLLLSIDGIGETTAARLIAEFGDLSGFQSASQLAAFLGVDPRVSQSGKRVPKRGGSMLRGDATLRAKLWMPVLTAVRKNAWLKAFYDRLIARGKLPKVAIVAAMRKLLHAIFSVVKHRRPFVPLLPVEGASIVQNPC